MFDGHRTVIIDPFLSGNNDAPFRARDIVADLILVTHAHNNHLGDAIEMSKRSNTPILCSFELGMHCESQGAKVINANIGGKNLYHAGDTALFGDMALISDQYDLDVAMLPIGGMYMMDAEDAVRAEMLLKAKKVVPMHYGRWTEADPYEFRDLIEGQGIGTAVVMRPGDAIIV